MRQSILALAFAASMAVAAPSNWSPNVAQYFSAASKEIQNAGKTNAPKLPCDLSKAVLPSTGGASLPGVPEGQKLLHVGVGRGTQV